MIEEKGITDFCDEEYLNYAMYVVENRALPSVIDGLKPTQRKVVHIANKIWKSGKEKPLKVFQLTGKVASDAYYHHGDCLRGSTKIQLGDGTDITIGKWFKDFRDKKLYVYCIDEETNERIVSLAESPRVGHITNEFYEIELEDGSIIECTCNHPFRIGNKWINAEDLNINMDILDFKTI